MDSGKGLKLMDLHFMRNPVEVNTMWVKETRQVGDRRNQELIQLGLQQVMEIEGKSEISRYGNIVFVFKKA